jgi:hypothetical protein
VRGYAVLLSTAIGLGSVGIFFSALVKRTQAATIITYFGVMAATLGAFFVFFFWNTMTNGSGFVSSGFGPIKGRPPEALLYLNPYFAQADVVCGVENGFGDWCDRVGFVSERSIFNSTGFGTDPGSGVIVKPPRAGGQPGGGVIGVPPANDGFVDDSGIGIQPFGVRRDGFWPKTAIAWLGLSAVLIFATVQLVSPTRRWRLGLPAIVRRLRRRAAA